MYYRLNNIKINYPVMLKPDPEDESTWLRVHSAAWFADKTDVELSAWAVTRHDDPVKPVYDESTQKLDPLDTGEYQVVELTEQELQARADHERERLDAIVISRFQAKAALLQADMLGAVEAYIDATEDALVKLAWAEAGFRRGSAMVNSIGAQLGLTEQQLDDLFTTAQTIEV